MAAERAKQHFLESVNSAKAVLKADFDKIKFNKVCLNVSDAEIGSIAVKVDKAAQLCVPGLMNNTLSLETIASCAASELTKSSPEKLFQFGKASAPLVVGTHITADAANMMFGEFCATTFTILSGARMSSLTKDVQAWECLVRSFFPRSHQKYEFASIMLSRYF
jgi:hypothetical protein